MYSPDGRSVNNIVGRYLSNYSPNINADLFAWVGIYLHRIKI